MRGKQCGNREETERQRKIRVCAYVGVSKYAPRVSTWASRSSRTLDLQHHHHNNNKKFLLWNFLGMHKSNREEKIRRELLLFMVQRRDMREREREWGEMGTRQQTRTRRSSAKRARRPFYGIPGAQGVPIHDGGWVGPAWKQGKWTGTRTTTHGYCYTLFFLFLFLGQFCDGAKVAMI